MRRAGRAGRQGRQAGRRVPALPRLPGRRLRRRRGRTSATSWPQAQQIADKHEREDATDALKDEVKAALAGQFEGREKEISGAFRALTKKVVRQRILRDKVRIDGRGLTDIRPLSAEVEVIPRVHGSALFERGETQILGVTTLNMLRMEQQLDTLLAGQPTSATCTTTTSRRTPPVRPAAWARPSAARSATARSPSGRSCPVLPDREEFPYAIRQVSEALGSNGSTSMGSVCASTLALLNAGVPLKAPVAGIAMGLVSDEVDGKTEYVALTDILGAEDAFGDMDFKVAGTKDFVTALQLDTKLDGIPSDVLAGALTQARAARLHILDVMGEAIDGPDEMSPYAPRVTTVRIPVDKIGAVIGPKGQMINAIQDETGARHHHRGRRHDLRRRLRRPVGAGRGGPDQRDRQPADAQGRRALPRHGRQDRRRSVRSSPCCPGKDGLVHISKLGGGKRIGKVEDVVNVGDKLQVEITDIDARGKISLVPVAATATVPARRRGRGSGRGRCRARG